jgi:hypothetical protein
MGGAEDSREAELETERKVIVEVLSERYLAPIAHHLAVGGLPSDYARERAAAKISAYSWCVMGPALTAADDSVVSLGDVVAEILQMHWDIGTKSIDADLDRGFLQRETASCRDDLRSSGGISD